MVFVRLKLKRRTLQAPTTPARQGRRHQHQHQHPNDDSKLKHSSARNRVFAVRNSPVSTNRWWGEKANEPQASTRYPTIATTNHSEGPPQVFACASKVARLGLVHPAQFFIDEVERRLRGLPVKPVEFQRVRPIQLAHHLLRQDVHFERSNKRPPPAAAACVTYNIRAYGEPIKRNTLSVHH